MRCNTSVTVIHFSHICVETVLDVDHYVPTTRRYYSYMAMSLSRQFTLKAHDQEPRFKRSTTHFLQDKQHGTVHHVLASSSSGDGVKVLMFLGSSD
jgi:hypothetical protein